MAMYAALVCKLFGNDLIPGVSAENERKAKNVGGRTLHDVTPAGRGKLHGSKSQACWPVSLLLDNCVTSAMHMFRRPNYQLAFCNLCSLIADKTRVRRTYHSCGLLRSAFGASTSEGNQERQESYSQLKMDLEPDQPKERAIEQNSQMESSCIEPCSHVEGPSSKHSRA